MGAGEEAAPWYHPAHRRFRFVFLAMLCFMTFGSYWCNDIPAALYNDVLNTYAGGSTTKYALFYTIYNVMNVVVVLFGGYFIDVIGLRIGAILFCFLITLGQLVFSFGASLHDMHTAYYVMLVGRAIFSLGGESLSVAQSAFAAKWFKGNELALAFGITLSFSRIGSFANFNVTPVMATHWGVVGAIWAGTGTCIISLVLTVVASISDRMRDKQLKLVAETAEKPKLPFRFSDIMHFPLSIWLLYIVCVCYYVPIFSFISVCGLSYIQSIFTNYSGEVGNRILSIPYAMSAVFAPVFGFLVDRFGRKPFFLVVSNGLMVGTFAIMLFILGAVHQVYILIIALVILGFSYSLCASSLWPCVPFLVHEERVGTAYAIMNSIQNGGLAIASLAVGALGGKHQQKRPVWFLAAFAVVSTGFSVILLLQDLAKGGILAKKSAKVEKIESEKSEVSPLLPQSSESINT